MTESRFQDPDFPYQELVIEVDELIVEVRQEEAARLDEPPYFCYRLANETHDADRTSDRWYRYGATVKRDWSNMEPDPTYGSAVPKREFDLALRAFEREKFESEFHPLKKDTSREGVPRYSLGDEELEAGEDVEVQTFNGTLRGVFSESATPWIGTLTFHFVLAGGKFRRASALMLPPNVMMRKVRK